MSGEQAPGAAPPSAPPPRESPVEILRRAPVSALLVVINFVVFFLAERAGGDTTKSATLIRYGAVWRHLVWDGQYWRLATAMFLHVGFLHLVWNSALGFRICAAAERAIGGWRFLALYVLSGIVASATSVIGHDAVSAGASGALFGVVGWRLVALRLQLGSFKAFTSAPGIRQELNSIGIWFVLGAFSGFDNYAHGGGMVFGALFSWVLGAPAARRRLRAAVSAAVAIAAVSLSLRPLPLIHAEARAVNQAQQALEHQDFSRVLVLTEPWLGSSSRASVLALRSDALLRLGRLDEALAVAEVLVAEVPSDMRGWVARGRARQERDDLDGAAADYDKAVELDPGPWAVFNRDWLRSHRPGAAH